MCTDLRIEPRELAERGFRFVKVPATLLLGRASAPRADIHPADLSDLLGRFGIDLIAERIESEGMVVDLLDYDVRFGQGFLFSPPRPVRAEALQVGAAEADEPTAAPDELTSEHARTRSRGGRIALGRLSPVMIGRIAFVHRTLLPRSPAGYDVVLCDVWGVVHNGVAAIRAACDALTRFRAEGGTVVLITNAPRPGDGGARFLDQSRRAARRLRRHRQLRRRDPRA